MMSSEMTNVSSVKDEDCPSGDTQGFMRDEKQGARYVTIIDSIANKFIISLFATLTPALHLIIHFPIISISFEINSTARALNLI